MHSVGQTESNALGGADIPVCREEQVARLADRNVCPTAVLPPWARHCNHRPNENPRKSENFQNFP